MNGNGLVVIYLYMGVHLFCAVIFVGIMSRFSPSGPLQYMTWACIIGIKLELILFSKKTTTTKTIPLFLLLFEARRYIRMYVCKQDR